MQSVLPLFRSYMKLEGYVEHIVYRNEENGYSVLNLVSEGQEITVVGAFITSVRESFWSLRAATALTRFMGSSFRQKASR